MSTRAAAAGTTRRSPAPAEPVGRVRTWTLGWGPAPPQAGKAAGDRAPEFLRRTAGGDE